MEPRDREGAGELGAPTQNNTTNDRSGIQWIAISAIGLEGAASITACNQRDNVPATVACPPLAHLFRAVSWRHRRLAFDLSKLDHAAFLSAARTLLSTPLHGGEEWGFPKWWTWSAGAQEETREMPGWWNCPTTDVVRAIM